MAKLGKAVMRIGVPFKFQPTIWANDPIEQFQIQLPSSTAQNSHIPGLDIVCCGGNLCLHRFVLPGLHGFRDTLTRHATKRENLEAELIWFWGKSNSKVL